MHRFIKDHHLVVIYYPPLPNPLPSSFLARKLSKQKIKHRARPTHPYAIPTKKYLQTKNMKSVKKCVV